MGKDRLEVTFLNTLVGGDYVKIIYNVGGTEYHRNIEWIAIRPLRNPVGSLYGIVQKSQAVLPVNNYDAIQYSNSISQLDTLNYFEVEQVGNKVIIQSKVDGLEFTTTSTSNTSKVTFNIIKDTSPALPALEINSVNIISGDCEKVTLEVTANMPLVAMRVPYNKNITPNSNKFTFEYSRGNHFNLRIEDTHGRWYSQGIKTPAILLSNNIKTKFIQGTLTVTYKPLTPLTNQPLEYSIDGVSFSSNNVFQVNYGTTTVYVRDSYGCTTSKKFTFIDRNKKTPYFFISKINAFRFKHVVDWDYKNIYKTDENTLSCETLDEVSNKEVQRWQTEDVITTQIRTNYENVQAFVIHNGSETPLNVRTARTFVNKKDSRDGYLIKRNGKTLLFFHTGNIYDYDSGNKIGEYETHGIKPYWLQKGRIIELDGIGSFEIQKSYYEPQMNFEVLEIDYDFPSGLDPYITPFKKVKVKSIYNIHPFNLFEFNTSFASYENQTIRIRVVATDSKLATITLISEDILIKNIHKNCLEVVYFNNENGDILYETGIKHKLRLPFEKITDKPTSDVEIHIGDTNVWVTKAEYYEGDIIEFSPLTKEVSKKLELALLHDHLTINGVAYCSEETPEKEQLGSSNLYTVKAKLIKKGLGLQGTSNILEVDSPTDVNAPNLINNGQGGFIKQGNGFISY